MFVILKRIISMIFNKIESNYKIFINFNQDFLLKLQTKIIYF